MGLFRPDLKKLEEKQDVSGLIKASKYKSLFNKREDPTIRSHALFFLSKIRDERAVTPLIKALEDEKDVRIREVAAAVLGNIKDIRAVDPLLRALNDKVVANKAAESLGKVGDKRAVEPLIQILKEDRPWLRHAAAVALGLLGATQAEGLLIDALTKESYEGRLGAVKALGMLKSTKAREPLVKLLKSKDWLVRTEAGKSLKKLDWEPKTESEKSWFLLALSDWNGLVKLGKAARRALRFSLNHDGGRVGEEAIKAYVQIGKPAKTVLEKALKDKNRTISSIAADALRRLEPPRKEVPPTRAEKEMERLSRSLKRNDRTTAEDSMNKLGEMREERAVGLLIRALINSDHAKTYVAALSALEQIGKPAVDPLLKALKSADRDMRDTEIRDSLALALAKIGDERALKPLKRLKYLSSYTRHIVDGTVQKMERNREAYERQKGICVVCKEPFEFEEMEADQIIPWYEGGKTSADNCQMLCKEDNRRKSGK